MTHVDIKGKDYVLVKDRVLAFNESCPNGSIETEIVSSLESQTVIVKAIIIPDVKNPTRRFCDYSQAKIGQGVVNTTSALENASTSAVGRALAYMGIGVIESIASADEMNKATNEIKSEPIKEVCKHENGWEIKIAGQGAKKPGANYKKCSDCGGFMGYIAEE